MNKGFNGWREHDEALYNTLTDYEKVEVDKILVTQLEMLLPHERISFKRIVKMVQPLGVEDLEFLESLDIIINLSNGNDIK